MPRASGRQIKYAYQDDDCEYIEEDPPTLNEWYTVMDEEDVSLLWHVVRQYNDESAAKDIQIRWTIDGNVFTRTVSVDSGTATFIYRGWRYSGAAWYELQSSTDPELAARYTPKHGHSFKVEVRITSALGTNQTLNSYCVPELLTET